jgi:hypothetical protein
MRYNYATGKPEPVDITGAEFKFTVYKPLYEVEIVAKEDATGPKITRKVGLAEEEFTRFSTLSTGQERTGFLASLPQVKAVYEEIANEIRQLTKGNA